MPAKLAMPSKHLILCHPLLLLPPIFPSIRVFSNKSSVHIRWPKYRSFSFSISPSNEYSGFISFKIDWFDLLAVQETLKNVLQNHSSKTSILQCSAFFMVQLSHPYMTTGKTIALTIWTFVSKMMSLLFYTLWHTPRASLVAQLVNVGDLGSIPGLGRPPGEGKGYPLQYSGLKNSMDSVVHAVAKSWTRLRNFHFHFLCGVHPAKTIIWKDTCNPVFTAALFTIARTWKQPKCPLTDEWIKMWFICTMEYSVQFSSVTQLYPTLCNPMNCSTPGLPVYHQLPESTQTHIHRVDNAIQPSHPLSSPSPPALNLSQHQGLFQWVSSSHQVAKVLEFQLQHQSFQWTPRTDLL